MITPKAGYEVDPNNPNAVRAIGSGGAPAPSTLAQDQAKAANQGAQGFDVLGNPVTETIKRTIDSGTTSTGTGGDAADAFLNTFRAPETFDQIRQRKESAAQGLIDTYNTKYDSDVAAAKQTGQERLNMDNAISVLSGLSGSTEASRTRGKQLEANDKELQAINNKRAMDIATVYLKISEDAQLEAREQLADATRSAEAIVARREKAQQKAVESIKTLAMSGTDYDAFMNNPKNEQVARYAIDSLGGEEAVRATFVLNRPKDDIIGSPMRIGNKYVQTYRNPLSGKVTMEQLDLPMDLPTEYKTFQQMGDNLVAIPDGWDGDTSKLRTVGSTLGTLDKLNIAIANKELNKPAPTPQRQTTVVDGPNGKILIDSQTGEKIADYGAGVSDTKTTQIQETLALAKELRKNDAVGKGSAVGASLAKMAGGLQDKGFQGNRTAFEARVESLKSNLTLDNLKLLKGAMSDKDLAFLNAVGSSLNTNMSEAQFDKELDRIITKFEGVGTAPSGNIITAPDGVQVQIID